jgi:hypothetical protein
MSQTNETYADRVVREAMLAATGGLDPNRVAQAVTDIVEAIAKQAAVLKAATYAPGDYEKISRSMAHAMKTADGVFRLVEFAAGRPDSRPDKGMDWLRALTDEQLRIVQGWVEASAEATAPSRPHGAEDGLPEARGHRSRT